MMNEEELREQNLRLKQHITSLEDVLARQKDVRKVVGELSEKVEQQGRELAEVRERLSWSPGPMPFPAQPDPTAMRFDANGEEGSVTCPDCAGSGKGADSITENAMWEAVESAARSAFVSRAWPNDARGVTPETHSVKDAVAEAIRQGLVLPRIDSENEEQVRVVANCFPSRIEGRMDIAKRILSALVAAQQEGAK